ncbi:ABC transporter permease [Acetobacteraceae bacterium H6797]|nr:ABC transporter permease [Acetobacteraceae bacterium H6797]
MPLFIAGRLLQALPVMFAVAFIAFAMFAFLGDPVTIMLGTDFTPAQRAALVHDLGLDRSFPVQFLHFIANAAQGEFGLSYRLSRPVSALLAERAPATLELALAAALFALALGIPMGILAALRPRALSSRLFLLLGLVGVSLPGFLIGILLILCFSVLLGWLPSFGRGETVAIGFWQSGLFTLSGLKSLILPAVTLGLYQLTMIMRLVRAEMLDVLRSDMIKFARARGLGAMSINGVHALRNILVPVITIAGLQLGSIIAFSIVTETVFQWPGLGLLFIQSVTVADIPVMSAYLLLTALVFVLINLVVDLLYYLVDPRLRPARGVAGGRR